MLPADLERLAKVDKKIIEIEARRQIKDANEGLSINPLDGESLN